MFALKVCVCPGPLKAISAVLELGSYIAPQGGGLLGILSKVVNATDRHFTKKHLENFAEIAASPIEMTQIIEEFAYKLILAYKGKITHELANDHVGIMIAAMFDGELKNVEKENIVTTLCAIVQKRSLVTAPTTERNFEPVSPSKGPIGKKLEDDHRNGSEFAGDLRKLMIVRNKPVKGPGTGNPGNTLSELEEMKIRSRLNCIYEDIFKNIAIPGKKGKIKDGLTNAVVERAQKDAKFKAAFLDTNYDTISKALETSLTTAIGSQTRNEDYETFATNVVNSLPENIAKIKEQNAPITVTI